LQSVPSKPFPVTETAIVPGGRAMQFVAGSGGFSISRQPFVQAEMIYAPEQDGVREKVTVSSQFESLQPSTH
jgi:hypothetical protein